VDKVLYKPWDWMYPFFVPETQLLGLKSRMCIVERVSVWGFGIKKVGKEMILVVRIAKMRMEIKQYVHSNNHTAKTSDALILIREGLGRNIVVRQYTVHSIHR
jgi:ABC-type Zn uptake system ZnuABC Zn-binding protein ZnuA